MPTPHREDVAERRRNERKEQSPYNQAGRKKMVNIQALQGFYLRYYPSLFRDGAHRSETRFQDCGMGSRLPLKNQKRTQMSLKIRK